MDFSMILGEAKDTIDRFKQGHPDGVVIIRWATATGKSRLSVELSKFFDIEVISSDSRQIFRKMDIGTDKISAEIRAKIPHHQIDIVNPDEQYTAGQWKQAVDQQMDTILKKGKTPFIVGGTGLYIDSVYKNFSMPECPPDPVLRRELEEKEIANPGFLHRELSRIDPEEAQKLHPHSLRYLIRALEIYYSTWITKTESFREQAPRHPLLMIGLRRDKESTNQLINARIKEMFQNGLVNEVEMLLSEGYAPSLQSMQGIGYKEVIGYLLNEYTYEKMEELLKRNTHHLAKKQRTWFRRYLAEGIQAPKPGVSYKVFEL